ncbi:MAG: hypothetical protein ACKO97_09930, partial [Actinomycetota bacterium]
SLSLLLAAMLVMALFIGALGQMDVSAVVVALFSACLLMLILSLVSFLQEINEYGGVLHYFRMRYAFGFFFGLAIVAAYVLGGFLMANERKIGWRVAVGAAASPFVLTFIAYTQIGASLRFRIFGGSLLSFAFDVAVLALLLHPQSREHQRIWYH